MVHRSSTPCASTQQGRKFGPMHTIKHMAGLSGGSANDERPAALSSNNSTAVIALIIGECLDARMHM